MRCCNNQSRWSVNLRFCNNQSFYKLDSLYSFAWNHFWIQRSGRSETGCTGDFLQESRALRSTFFPSLSFRVFGFSWKLGFGVHQHFCWVLSRSASTRNVVQICRASNSLFYSVHWAPAFWSIRTSKLGLFQGKRLRIQGDEDPMCFFLFTSLRKRKRSCFCILQGDMSRSAPHSLNKSKITW